MAKMCIGLDLGSSAIKMAQVKVGRGGSAQLVAFGVEPVMPDSIVDGTIMNQGAVVDAVRALTSRLRLRQKEVALAISGHSVIIKKIFVPAMTEDELEEQIPWEAEQHIPFDKNDVEIDHQILSGKNAQGQMELLLVAAKKEVVRDYTAVAREAQLSPVVVDIASFALQNAYELSYQTPSPNETIVLINVGASVSNINIISGGTSAFTRDVTTGGGTFTDEIKRQLNVTHEEAEHYKLHGMAGGAPQGIDRILQISADQMAGEFSKSLDFFLASHPDALVSKIYLSGGGASVPQLHKAITNRAHVAVEVMDPFRRMTVPEGTGPGAFDPNFIRTHAAQSVISVGLALRAPGDKFQ
jgi:type IV pilus assembly protein PilM